MTIDFVGKLFGPPADPEKDTLDLEEHPERFFEHSPQARREPVSLRPGESDLFVEGRHRTADGRVFTARVLYREVGLEVVRDFARREAERLAMVEVECWMAQAQRHQEVGEYRRANELMSRAAAALGRSIDAIEGVQ